MYNGHSTQVILNTAQWKASATFCLPGYNAV
jgi:hypothetical protein